MWLRTTMNYQYKNGGTFNQSVKTLFKDGGIPRFYRGYSAAVAIGPLSRFGDTAANSYVTSIFEKTTIPITIQTFCGSTVAGFMEIIFNAYRCLKNQFTSKWKIRIKYFKNKNDKS